MILIFFQNSKKELTHPVQIEAILSRQAGEVKFNNIIFIKRDIAINQIFDN